MAYSRRGMASSALGHRDHVATPYGWWRRPLPNYLFAKQAAAGPYTTAPDLARFVAAHMSSATSGNAGRGVLAPATAALFMEPNPGRGERIVFVTNSDRGSNLIDDISCERVDWATQQRPGFIV
jgi:hypothetical protein